MATTKTKAQLETEIKELREKMRSRALTPPAQIEAKTLKDTTLREELKDLSVDTVVQHVTSVGLEAQRSLSSLSEQLITETKELEKIRALIKVENEELDRLYGVGTGKAAIETLLTEYEAKMKELNFKREELNEEIEREREHFNEESLKALAQRAEERTRQEAEFQYSFLQQCRKMEDDFHEDLRKRRVTESIRQEALIREWAEREKTLLTQESEFLALKEKVAQFPEELERAKKEYGGTIASSLTRDHKHMVELLQKDAERQRQLAESQIQNLTATVQSQLTTIDELQTQLARSNDKVESIAKQALESASSTRTLAEVANMYPREPAPRAKG